MELLFIFFHPININGTYYCVFSRSSLHGKGLNRFWSSVEGYHGPIFLMISAHSIDSQEVEENSNKWIVGFLSMQGFENKNDYYGNSGILYAISPVFHVFPPSGKYCLWTILFTCLHFYPR